MEFIFEKNKAGVLDDNQLKLDGKTYNIKDIKTADYIIDTNYCILTLKTGKKLKFKITDITSDSNRETGTTSIVEKFFIFLEKIVERNNYDVTLCN